MWLKIDEHPVLYPLRIPESLNLVTRCVIAWLTLSWHLCYELQTALTGDPFYSVVYDYAYYDVTVTIYHWSYVYCVVSVTFVCGLCWSNVLLFYAVVMQKRWFIMPIITLLRCFWCAAHYTGVHGLPNFFTRLSMIKDYSSSKLNLFSQMFFKGAIETIRPPAGLSPLCRFF